MESITFYDRMKTDPAVASKKAHEAHRYECHKPQILKQVLCVNLAYGAPPCMTI